LADFIPCHHLAGVLKQENQQPEGLVLEADSATCPAQFTGCRIGLESPEPDRPPSAVPWS
jgi:hypothetical protein